MKKKLMAHFIILNSIEYENYLAHKCLNANNCWHFNNYEIVGILAIMSRINTALRVLEQEMPLLFSMHFFKSRENFLLS